ncbi:MAG: putative amidohydrolase YtcJ [Paraglaciecola sp.]|jgi:predicted amidohydrolase YtcJ
MKLFLLIFSILFSGLAFASPSHIYNVRGYTLNESGQLIQFSDMLFDGGKVIATGNKDIATNYPEATKIDGQNKVLLPGLIDAHGHLLGLGQTLLQVDVRGLTSSKKTVEQARLYALQNPKLSWIVGRGWNQVLWPDKQMPLAEQLDEYIQDKPVWLTRIDGHAGWANSKALSIAGINQDTLDPPGGKILRNEYGQPSGVLIDNAMNLLEKHLPQNTKEVLTNRLKAAGEHLLSLGVTSMHDAGIPHEVYHFYQDMAAQQRLPLRIYAMLAATDPQLALMLDRGYVGDQYDFLSIRSVKVYGDGALGSRGAAMLKPYSDDHDNSGLLLTRETDIQPLFDLVLSKGFQLNYHAIGDRANYLALNQYADTFKRIGGQELRNRVEHAQVIAVNDIPRFLTLGIIPSMQPTHATSDMNMAEERIGAERLKGAYAWQTLLQQGSPLAFGSDFPVELANPFFGLHAAVTRQNRQNQPQDGWVKEQALNIKQAFRAFTLDGAYAAHQDNVLGSLTPGKWADFILIDKDIFAVPESDIWQTKVLETWIGGMKRYELE